MSNDGGSWQARRLRLQHGKAEATEPDREPPDSGNRNRLGWVLLIVGIVLIWIVVAIMRSDGPEEAATPATVMVKYEVEGTAKYGSVTASTPDGTYQSDIDIPLINKAGSPGLGYLMQAGAFTYIAAQNGEETGTVTCRITTGAGHVISEVTSSGAYAIATCQGVAR